MEVQFPLFPFIADFSIAVVVVVIAAIAVVVELAARMGRGSGFAGDIVVAAEVGPDSTRGSDPSLQHQICCWRLQGHCDDVGD